jgi:hypothetical protein
MNVGIARAVRKYCIRREITQSAALLDGYGGGCIHSFTTGATFICLGAAKMGVFFTPGAIT